MNVHPLGLAYNSNCQTFKNPPQIARHLNPDQPVRCFSANALSRQINLFKDNFPGSVAYAVKANPCPLVIKTAAATGLEVFDVASINEMELVHSIAPNAILHYHNPVRSRREIYTAWHNHNCRRYSVDELSELKKIINVIDVKQDQAPSIEIAIRFRLPAGGHAVHDFSEKFGQPPDAAAHLLAQVKLCGFTPVLTFHPGSQCLDPASWKEHIITAADISRKANVRIVKLNVGGGFPVNYASHHAPDLRQFFNQIASTTDAAFARLGIPQLECEPGRAIVAPSTSLLTRVKLVRQESSEVFLNDGIYGNLMEVSQAPELQPEARLIRNGQYHMSNLKPFTLYGPTCDPLDRLPGSLMLPADIAEDDYVEFQCLGAYGSATATLFNGYGQSTLLEVEDL